MQGYGILLWSLQRPDNQQSQAPKGENADLMSWLKLHMAAQSKFRVLYAENEKFYGQQDDGMVEFSNDDYAD